jgi:glycosyltransferase involved in cell wall biosynthesis
MKIGFDVSQTGKAKAGCGYFADTLIGNLVTCEPNNEYLLYSTFGTRFWDSNHGKSTRRIKQNNCIHLLNDLSHQESLTFWSGVTPIDEALLGNPDIVHANNFSCPSFSNARVVYTLYDLSFLDHPEFTSEENRWQCFNGVFDAALRADFIIAISEYSRQRFLHIFPHFPEERTRTIYLASRFNNSSEEKAVSGLNPNNFWLSVGTLEPRKNLRKILSAYKQYIDLHCDPKPLVLAGGQGWLEDDIDQFIANLGLTKYVQRLGYVDDATLTWLYKNCWAFVYPSVYEGFGLPVLEAMSLGAPVITSNTTSLPEVGGDAVLYVNPAQEFELVKAFEKLMDKNLRNCLKDKSKQQSNKFAWAETAEQAYVDVLKMPNKSK